MGLQRAHHHRRVLGSLASSLAAPTAALTPPRTPPPGAADSAGLFAHHTVEQPAVSGLGAVGPREVARYARDGFLTVHAHFLMHRN